MPRDCLDDLEQGDEKILPTEPRRHRGRADKIDKKAADYTDFDRQVVQSQEPWMERNCDVRSVLCVRPEAGLGKIELLKMRHSWFVDPLRRVMNLEWI